MKRARLARCFFYERLNNVPVRLASITHDDNAFRTNTTEFPAHLTPELARELDKHSREFLASRGIAHEPASWCYPADLFGGLHLPGLTADKVNFAELHRLAVDKGASLSAAAPRLGTKVDQQQRISVRAKAVAAGVGRQTGHRRSRS